MPLAELREQPLISLPVGTGIRSRLEDACAATGFAPTIAFGASDPSLLADLVGRSRAGHAGVMTCVSCRV